MGGLVADIDILISGFFGTSDRGFLGWSGLYLGTTPSRRRIMFDTAGYNERGAIPKLLQQRGLTPANIDYVVLSHLHFDHAANWDLFANAEIVVHENEVTYAQASDDNAILRYSVPALLAHKRLRLITGETVAVEDGVQLCHVPGHTPGSIALVMNGSVLSGDALKSRWDLRRYLTDTWNDKLALQSIQKITTLGHRIYPGHDVPLERSGNEWRPSGTPSVRIQFPDGSEHIVQPPED
jgi:glyoxylase-like metal-dependent hydrolase (beta-lactamase superfamily II)